jgi:hypothetical protein
MGGVAYAFVVAAEFPIMHDVLQGRLGHRATLVFNPADANNVQRGQLVQPGASAGSAPARFDEYLYSLGVVS